MEIDPHAETVQRLILLLKDERRRRGISQESLAKAAGISRTEVRHVESGDFKPTLYTLLKMADALDIDLAVLLRKARKPLG